MTRVTVADAERNFRNIVDRVCAEGISVDLELDAKVVARITPAGPSSPLKVRELNAFLRALPRLGDDAVAFCDEVRAVRRRFPAEADPWD
jgi:antitoxin (DNA-binding transcriptional repressor) of toxin-antitoxin stability system